MHWVHGGWLWGGVGVALLGLLHLWGEQRRRTRSRALVSAAGVELVPARVARARGLAWGLRMLACLLLVVACAGPQWGMREERVESRGADVVVVVDCSASMNAQDYKPSRLEAARLEVGELVRRLAGNRLGLVGFAGEAFVFCPLTLDSGAAELFLDQLDTNAIPIPGTSLGTAIKVGASLFGKGAGHSRFMILISDGEDHRSKPLDAAREAASQGIVIHTVGIGTAQGQKIPATDPASGRDDVVRDADGNEVVSKLDAATLRDIARATGGTFTEASPGADMLGAATASIVSAEKMALASASQNRYHHRYYIFAGLALLALLCEALVASRLGGLGS